MCAAGRFMCQWGKNCYHVNWKNTLPKELLWKNFPFWAKWDFLEFLKSPLFCLEPPFWCSRNKQAISDVKNINSGTEKGDFMHACFPYIPFFKTPVLLHPSATQLQPELLTRASNVTVLWRFHEAFERGLRRMACQNGAKFERFEKLLKNHVVFKSKHVL